MSKNIQTNVKIPSESRGVIYRANGRIETVNPKKDKYFTLEELEEIVGGKIEVMPLLRKYIIIFNENCRYDTENWVQNVSFPQFCGDIIICNPDSW